MEKYNVDYFIDKFSKIPSEDFITRSRSNFNGSKRCAHGWCISSNNRDVIEMSTSEEEIYFKNLLKFLDLEITGFAPINNQKFGKYQQETPKERILAALYDIKAKQEAENVKERIVYVTIDQEVRKLQKEELILN